MDGPKDRVFRGYLSSADVERIYPARVARVARGELTYADQGRINEEISCIDREWRGGHFNGVEYFHFRFPEQGARMAAYLMKHRLHRFVPGSSQAPTPDEVDAAWARLAQESNPRLGAIDKDAHRDRASLSLRAAPGRLLLGGSCCRGEAGREDGSVHRRPADVRGRLFRMGRTRTSPMVLALYARPPPALTRFYPGDAAWNSPETASSISSR
jgi:hypothetical protein